MPSDNIYAIATAAAKKAGYSDFDEGSDGEKKREEIVLALKRRGMKKATYGANNDQARKTGQRISVERKPRLNPNKLGVSDILNKARKDNPRKKPNIVAQGRENDLYPTGTQFAAGAKDKSPVKKRFANAEEDNEHQLAVGRRDGETDKLYSPAGSTIQAEHVGAVSKAILKQGLLDTLLQKKDDNWPYKRFTREQAEKIANSRGLRSAANVTQTYLDEEEETKDDRQPRQKSRRSRNKRRRRGRNAQSTTVEDTIPSPEEKTQSQMEFDDDVSEDKGENLPHGDNLQDPVQRGGSRRGSKAQKLIPPGGWQQKASDSNAIMKAALGDWKNPKRPLPQPEDEDEYGRATSPPRPGYPEGQKYLHGLSVTSNSPNLGLTREERKKKAAGQRERKAAGLRYGHYNPATGHEYYVDYKYRTNRKMMKAREQGDGKGVDPTGKDPLRGRANKHNERFVNADMGAMSYMAKDDNKPRKSSDPHERANQMREKVKGMIRRTPDDISPSDRAHDLRQARLAIEATMRRQGGSDKGHLMTAAPADQTFSAANLAKDYDGDREARIKATRDHFKHLLLKTTCLCEKRGVVMAIGMKKGIGDIARSVGAGVKGAVQGAKQGIQDATSNKPMPTVAWPKGGDAGSQSLDWSQTKFKKKNKPTPRGQAGVDPNVTMRDADTPAAQAKARRVSGVDRYKNTPAGQAARARDPRDTSGDVKFMQQTKKMMKSGNGSPLASAEKPVAVMAAEQSGLYSVDGKNLELDPMANKAPMENVNQTDAATRKASVNIDSRGRNTYIQLEDEPSEKELTEEQDFKDYKEKTIGGVRGRIRRNQGVIGGGSSRPEADFNLNTGPGMKDWGKRGSLSAYKRRNRPVKDQKKAQREADVEALSGRPMTAKDIKHKGSSNGHGKKEDIGETLWNTTNFQNSVEPTICSSKAVFNSILEKTYYDDQVLERYKDSENGKNKRKTKSRHITNDITDTAGQQTNKTRGI